MIKIYQSIPFFMANSFVALTSAKRDAEVLTLFGNYNLTEANIDELLQQHAQIRKLDEAQKRLHEEQYKAWRIYDTQVELARESFYEYRRLTEIAFVGAPEESRELVKLCTNVKRSKKQLAWLENAHKFFTRAIEEIESTESTYVLDRYTTVGVTKEKLEAALVPVATALEKKAEHLKCKGDAEEKIRERDAEIMDLFGKMKRVVELAKLAFKEKPQFLEKLAITKLSDGYRRQKKDEKKNNEEEEPPTGTDPNDPNAQTTDPNTQDPASTPSQ